MRQKGSLFVNGNDVGTVGWTIPCHLGRNQRGERGRVLISNSVKTILT